MLKVISKLIIGTVLTFSWSNSTTADTSKVVWKYGFYCGDKTIIIGTLKVGWALWGSPNSDIGTTYDGWMWTTDEGGSTISLRSLQGGKNVLHIDSDGTYESYECSLIPDLNAVLPNNMQK